MTPALLVVDQVHKHAMNVCVNASALDSILDNGKFESICVQSIFAHLVVRNKASRGKNTVHGI